MPCFLVSLLFNQITVFDEYLLWILLFYIVVLSLNYYRNNFVVLCLDRLFLIFLSLLIFVNNKIIIKELIPVVFFLSILVIIIYIIAFFFYKKYNKIFILNFSKLSSFIELMLVVFVLLFGIKNRIVINILFFAMCDILYKVIILSITFNLKKKFSIQ